VSPDEIIFSPRAEREMKKLEKSLQKQVFDLLENWQNGHPQDIEKIRSQPNFFRIRAGDLRLIFYPMTKGRCVILMIRDRKSAYKNLGNLSSMLASAVQRLGIQSARR